jgi:hypothetical protein
MIVNCEWETLKKGITNGEIPLNARLRINSPTTMFLQVILFGDEDIVSWFLDQGVRPLGADVRAAVNQGNLPVVKKLAQAGGDLHYYQVPTLTNNFVQAILRDDLEMAEFLRRSGVSIRPDLVGYDALELSLRRESPEGRTIEYLKSLGFQSAPTQGE